VFPPLSFSLRSLFFLPLFFFRINRYFDVLLRSKHSERRRRRRRRRGEETQERGNPSSPKRQTQVTKTKQNKTKQYKTQGLQITEKSIKGRVNLELKRSTQPLPKNSKKRN